jgi:SAM-dependent methyltransferase
MSEAGIHQAAAVGFDRSAIEYERARPSYPAAAVDHVVARLGIGSGRRVLDLAAGTGKLTRLLVASGAELVAVEPVPGMREQLESVIAGIEVHRGTAEAIPLDDESVDAVVCAQAFHWFDGPQALAEIGRVLRPGSGLAVIFNLRDDSVDWVRRLSEITGVDRAPRPHHDRSRAEFAALVEANGGYGPVEVSTFRNRQEMTEDLLVDRVASQSYVGAMADDERTKLLDQVRDLARTHEQLAGRDSFELPYDTEVAICFRR